MSTEAITQGEAVFAAALASVRRDGSSGDPHALLALGRARTRLDAARALISDTPSAASSALLDDVLSEIAETFSLEARGIGGKLARERTYAAFGSALVRPA